MEQLKMQFEDKSTLIFDLDGTLVDSAPDLARAGNLMLAKLGKETFSEQCFRNWIGNGARVMVQRALSGSADIDPKLDPILIEKALAIFLQAYAENVCVKTRLYPGVASTLRSLKAQGYHLVIATNKPDHFIEPILKGLKIDQLIELSIGGETLPQRKPDPAQLHHICEKLGVGIEQCLMVGDSKNDILAANAAGMDSIGLTYGYNYGEDISQHGPSMVLNRFADIEQVLLDSELV